MRKAEEALSKRNVANLSIISIKQIEVKVKLENGIHKLQKERPVFVTRKAKHKAGSPFWYLLKPPVSQELLLQKRRSIQMMAL